MNQLIKKKPLQMNNSSYFAVATLLLGWLLSESSQYLRNRSSRVKATNRALSELLEIRHIVYASQATLELIVEKFNLGVITKNQIRGIMPTPLKVDEVIRQRFNDALTDMANYDPFLTYTLRGKDIIGTIETYFTQIETQDIKVLEANSEQMELLEKILLPVLDEAILKLAKSLGFISWWRARQHLTNKAQIPDDFIKFLEGLAISYKNQNMAIQ